MSLRYATPADEEAMVSIINSANRDSGLLSAPYAFPIRKEPPHFVVDGRPWVQQVLQSDRMLCMLYEMPVDEENTDSVRVMPVAFAV